MTARTWIAAAAMGTALLVAGIPGTETAAADVPALASDFNGDGFADLPVGIPGEDLPAFRGGPVLNAVGAVEVLYGSANGLTATGSDFFRECSSCGTDDPEAADQYGRATASGDFDGDGFADLAVGIPGDNVGGMDDAGAVHVLYGSPGGLTTQGGQFLTQCGPLCGLGDAPEVNDDVGGALASGDFNADGRWDLAVAAPAEDVGSIEDAGLVTVLYGSPSGLGRLGSSAVQIWHQSQPSVLGSSEDNDRLGFALAAGQLGNGPQDDLAMGVPLEDLNADPNVPGDDVTNGGAVNVLFGSSGGLVTSGNELWFEHLRAPGAPPTPTEAESFDLFGLSLAAADLGNGATEDLTVGVPGDDVGAEENAGGLDVFYGGSGGLTQATKQWNEVIPRRQSLFGYALAAADFGRGAPSDVVAGAPRPLASGGFPPPYTEPGSVGVIYGSSSGLTKVGRQTWSQAGDIEGDPEPGDFFGFALTAGQYGRGAYAEAAIGIQNERVAGIAAGGVQAIYGSSTGLAAAGDQLWTQNSSGVADVSESGDIFACVATCAVYGPFGPVGLGGIG
jgi:hypothetical protein